MILLVFDKVLLLQSAYFTTLLICSLFGLFLLLFCSLSVLLFELLFSTLQVFWVVLLSPFVLLFFFLISEAGSHFASFFCSI
jgi:hypothetical protein